MSCWSGDAGGDIEGGEKGRRRTTMDKPVANLSPETTRVRGAILAGGGATRFAGKPKGLERVGGERILDRLARTMESALGEPPVLVANAPDAPTWRPDLRTVSDVRPGLGALG